ncbi:MAG: TetR/AcrR family transcriptional regulator [Rhodobacteraceae bacterium]|nr:TetR/AcrR family transcriptional regulator [Paracoccaceae bacterium]
MALSDDVESHVSDKDLIARRRRQIVNAAVKLFSKQGYAGTTVQQISKQAGVSTGLVYQYFGDKDDILFLALKQVLDTYEHDIPPQYADLDHPLERLFAALRAYCTVVHTLRDATVLAYRATKSLPLNRRIYIENAEIRTNRIFRDLLDECVAQGLMKAPDLELLTYQFVLFSHAWALKQWAFSGKYDLDSYVEAGGKLLIEPFLTGNGRAYWNTL